MSRIVSIACALCCGWLAACASEPEPAPVPVSDAQITPVLDAAPLEDRVTIPIDPRDASITEPTPVLDLPLVIARPNEPLSTARLAVMVIDETGAPVADVGVSTGGPAVFSNLFGLASVTAVYGADFTNVYAFGRGHTLTHARIAIRAGETSYVVLMVAPLEVARLDDALAGGTVTTESGTVTFQAASFELPWGGMAGGPSVVHLAALDTPAEAAAVPASMEAIIDGVRSPLAGVLAFELRVAQGATELELLEEVVVALTWPEAVATSASSSQTLYFFDPKAAAFVPRGRFELSEGIRQVRATIDRLGSWLIGAPGAPLHCLRATVQTNGLAVPDAGLLLGATSGFVAARASADGTGAGCALLPNGGAMTAYAFGELDGQALASNRIVTASELPASCDDACTAAPLEVVPIAAGCVRATVVIPWLAALGTSVSVQPPAGGQTLMSVPTGESFCFDGYVGTQLVIDSTGMTCTPSNVITVAEPMVPSGSCGSDGCVDVGAITCCRELEACANAADDDCDGLVDEGCMCGTADCSGTAAVERCCAGTVCGQVSAFTGECVGFENGFPIGCPSAEVPSELGGTQIAQGCCRSDTQCGLLWGTVGCVAAADVPRVWGPSTTLASTACQ